MAGISAILTGGETALRRTPPAVRTAAALAAIVAAVACVIPSILAAEPSPDDLTWVDRYLVSWRLPEERVADPDVAGEEYRLQYYYALNHPSFARIVYGALVRAVGITERPARRYNYDLGRLVNLRLGNALPQDQMLKVRWLNIGFFTATVLAAFAGLWLVGGNRLLAVIGALPVALDPVFSADFRAVVPYIGADTLFIFLTVLFWLAWLRLREKTVAAAFALGVLGGLATATKVNGAFMVAGAVFYYALSERGARRAWAAGLVAVLSLIVFLALNPICMGGGLSWAHKVFDDTIHMMEFVRESKVSQTWARYTRMEIILAGLPLAVFLPAVAGLVWRARKERWVEPTIFWSASIVFANLGLIYMADPRYTAPARTAFVLLVSAGAISAFKARQAAARAGTDEGQG
jgi:hypothetical protein